MKRVEIFIFGKKNEMKTTAHTYKENEIENRKKKKKIPLFVKLFV